MDGTLEKAVHPDPQQRYAHLSEFIHDLSHPNPAFMNKAARPLLERNPLGFWRGLAIALALLNLILIYLLTR
jgi:hypothetical protein